MNSGILILDKPAGLTSHDVVARVRRVLHTRKVGHAGTLDPDATGVLVLCVGDATRLLEYVAADEKVYEGGIVFGEGTDTDDASGEVVAKADASQIDLAVVRAALSKLTGRILQRPPRFSAVHVNGKRAYDLARQGVDFELEPREVLIHEFSVEGFQSGELATARFRVHCSKGTYIRSLCRDLGELVGVPAHMSELRRIQSGVYGIEESVPLATFEASDNPGAWLRPMEEALRNLIQVEVGTRDATRLSQGQTIEIDRENLVRPKDLVAILDSRGQLVGITEVVSSGESGRGMLLRPRKVLWKGGNA